jgi:hypothetical protein
MVAFWGLESNFGQFTGTYPTIQALATLAYDGRRQIFRDELIAALKIIDEGKATAADLKGSWAGAMGQPQFMPSSFMNHAVDFSGDGRSDIWTNVADVLASIANYLQKAGWTPGLTQGFEVTLPAGFDFRQSRGAFADWRVLGLRRADGGALPTEGQAVLFFPSGARGPAFLVTDNFVVIKRYNNSDVYALAVSQLADRMQGRKPARTEWPSDDRQLSVGERVALELKSSCCDGARSVVINRAPALPHQVAGDDVFVFPPPRQRQSEPDNVEIFVSHQSFDPFSEHIASSHVTLRGVQRISDGEVSGLADGESFGGAG